ncbi:MULTISPECIES: tetratricopeptide repeat protein [unclassified Solwaraspora]|uniref:tetratricopeptide repeat protein n=1 Tax=unclassified Solwaraspora TaxID=2627926 RepID=UPI00248AE2D3|nr:MULTISPECIES: tetratricopeptide repeat protein [unclassified Solwaraspora]WBB99289.1 tetratricopeptide repeat protein [Solwaraspora sp. WMMA2059]WBC22160.1 tetratricopeptide repeat protein [Solwaraspora sp. WMMA2080]WJK35797.1 tetratricopeptide repeat protein [Solwaraspora sp. WMMA2065]
MSQQVHPDFPRRLRALRVARNMTQRELARGSLSVSYISLLEAGRRSPKPEVLRQLAQTLGCSVAELAGEADAVATRPAALTLSYGRLAIEAGDPTEAERQFSSVLATAAPDPLTRTEAQLGLARALAEQGRLVEAAQQYESLLRDNPDGPAFVASLGMVISWIRCLYELGELQRVIEVGMGTLDRVDRLGAWESEDAVRLLATVAAAHCELGDLRQAERLLHEGLQRADRIGSPRARAAVLWNASQVACEQGSYREALELAEEALAFFRQDRDRRSAARLLTAYGCILLSHTPPRIDEARTTFERALRELTEVGGGIDRGYVLTELSRTLLLDGDAAGAVRSARRSLAELGGQAHLERARAQTALAAALAAAGDITGSREMFAGAAATLGGLRASRQASRAWAELGDVLADTGDPVGAVEAFRKATAAVHLGLQSSRRAG